MERSHVDDCRLLPLQGAIAMERPHILNGGSSPLIWVYRASQIFAFNLPNRGVSVSGIVAHVSNQLTILSIRVQLRNTSPV